MSTIASPRETSLPPSRRIASITPTSSTRPSLEAARSLVGSPVNASHPHAPVVAKRSNRAALREYYKLRAGVAGIPRIEVSDSEVPASDLDVQEFKADEYISKVSAESSMEDLLKLYTRVVGEVRALDAEKKALVYDNYSKLISATETIQKAIFFLFAFIDFLYSSLLTLLEKIDALQYGSFKSNGLNTQSSHYPNIQPSEFNTRRVERVHPSPRIRRSETTRCKTPTTTAKAGGCRSASNSREAT